MEKSAANFASQGAAQKTTELVFILDRSGSMAGLEPDTIGGFNAMIAKQRKLPGRGFVTTVLFDDEVQVLTEHEPLESVGELTEDRYYVGGCTALLDAVGETVARVNKAQKANPEGRPDHTIVVITTDGMENASTHYSLEKVRRAIEKRQHKNGWEFIFLGANIDAVSTAGHMGIHAKRAADYDTSPDGTRAVYQAVDAALCAIRMESSDEEGWKDVLGR